MAVEAVCVWHVLGSNAFCYVVTSTRRRKVEDEEAERGIDH